MAKIKKKKPEVRAKSKTAVATKPAMKKKAIVKPVRPVISAKVITKSKETPKEKVKEKVSEQHTERRAIIPPKNLSAEMVQIRSRLVQMLSDMQKDIEHEVHNASDRDAAHINDTSDMATDAAEGDLALRIAESETVEASEIERAIEKVDAGTYGICEVCNKPIGADRILFLPYVTMCIKCQELAEIRKRTDEDELDDLAEGSAEFEG